MRLRLALIAVTGLVLAACASDATQGASTTRDPDPPTTSDIGPAAPAPDSILPDVEVIEVTTEEKVNIASLVPNDKPLLLWFWAPH